MKKSKVVLVIMALVGLLVLAVPAMAAAQYLGESTWTLSINQHESGPVVPAEEITFKGCLTHVGGPYYSMQGYVDPAPDGIPIVSGGGVLIGEVLYLTLNTSQKHPGTDREGGVVHLELAKDSLSGTFYTLERSFDSATAGGSPIFRDHYSSGDVTRTGSPIILTPAAGVAANSLLLMQ